MQQLRPDHFLVGGGQHIELNEDAGTVGKLREQLQDAEIVAERAGSGAAIAKMLLKYPDIGGFVIYLSGDNEYDDQGGYYWSTSVSVGSLDPDSGTLEEHEHDLVLESIEQDLEDGWSETLYRAAAGGPENGTSYQITVLRPRIGALLDADRISGLAVWDRVKVEST